MVEQSAHNRLVVGSIPTGPTNIEQTIVENYTAPLVEIHRRSRIIFDDGLFDIGGPGWYRTNYQSVMSRLLYQ